MMEQDADVSEPSCSMSSLTGAATINKRRCYDPRSTLTKLHNNFCGLCGVAELNCACAFKLYKMSMEASAALNSADDCRLCRNGQVGFMVNCESCFGWFHGSCINVSPEEAKTVIRIYYCDRCREEYTHLKIQYYTELSMQVTTQSVEETPAHENLLEKAAPLLNCCSALQKDTWKISTVIPRGRGRPQKKPLDKQGSISRFCFMDKLDRTYRHYGKSESMFDTPPPKLLRSRTLNSESEQSQTGSVIKSSSAEMSSADVVQRNTKKNKADSPGSRQRFDVGSQHRKKVARAKTSKNSFMSNPKLSLTKTLSHDTKNWTIAGETQTEPGSLGENGNRLYRGQLLPKFVELDDPVFKDADIQEFLHQASHGNSKLLEDIVAHFSDLKLQEEVMYFLQTVVGQPGVQDSKAIL